MTETVTDIRRKGDFVAHISYIPIDNDYVTPDVEKEPALIIAPFNASLHGKRYAAIGLSALYKYGLDDKYLIQQSMQIAERLGVGAVGGRQVADIILDWIDDLVNAEEYEMVEDKRHPEEKKVQTGEVSIYVGDEKLNEIPIKN